MTGVDHHTGYEYGGKREFTGKIKVDALILPFIRIVDHGIIYVAVLKCLISDRMCSNVNVTQKR